MMMHGLANPKFKDPTESLLSNSHHVKALPENPAFSK
jgi:hypothetical protein